MFKKKIFVILFMFILFIALSLNLNCYGFDENLQINSEAVVLMDLNSGNKIYEKNLNKKMYPASTTKILTAIITLENCSLTDKVTATSYAINQVPASYVTANILPEETFTIEQLLTLLLIPSANDAGFVLAEHISGSTENFAKLMNKKASEIGCTNSNFTNPCGLHNTNHYSTANDMSKIAMYCMKNSSFRKIVSQSSCTIPSTNKSSVRKYDSTNLLLDNGNYHYDSCIGIKTGYTQPAKGCLISACKKNGIELLCIVLGGNTTKANEDQRYTDSIKLFDYGFENYPLKMFPKIIKNSTLGNAINSLSENISLNVENIELTTTEKILGIFLELNILY